MSDASTRSCYTSSSSSSLPLDPVATLPTDCITEMTKPLEHPPLPPSPLIRLYETRNDSPSSTTLERRQATQPQCEPMFVSAETAYPFTYANGMNNAYGIPHAYLPYMYQVPSLGNPSLSPGVTQEDAQSSSYLYDCRAPQESVSKDDPVPERDTSRVEVSHVHHGAQPSGNDTEWRSKSSVKSCNESDFRPQRSDSPRTIASSYERGRIGMTGDRAQLLFTSNSSGTARIRGVPVFIQAAGERSLLDIPLVDLFVAVSLIAGTAPSQHNLTSTGCLLVDMPSVQGVNRLLHCDRLCGVGVCVSIPDAYQKSSGVIRDVPASYTEGELLDTLRDKGVIHVKRLMRLRDEGGNGVGTTTPTGKVVLTFRRNAVRPPDVQLGGVRYKLRDFMDRPARCFKCQRLGHISKHCYRKQRCKRCSGHHDITNCPYGDLPRRCGNCGGSHYPSYKGCPAYTEALKRVKSFLNVS